MGHKSPEVEEFSSCTVVISYVRTSPSTDFKVLQILY